MIRRPPRSTRTDTLFPYTTLFLSCIEILAGQRQCCRAGVTFDRRLPRDRRFKCVGRAPDVQIRNQAQAGNVFNRLMRRTIFAKTDRIMREHRSEEHTSELQSLMRISYAVFCLKKKPQTTQITVTKDTHNSKHNTLET